MDARNTLVKDLNELEAYNYFHSAYDCERNHDKTSFSSKGFLRPIRRPKIGEFTPDFLLIKESYALIVECKSGHIYNPDIERATHYKNISTDEIQRFCSEAPSYEGIPAITNSNVAFQYYANIIQEAEKNNVTILNGLLDKVPIFICDRENGLYHAYKRNKMVLSDRITEKVLQNGINIPKLPILPDAKERFLERSSDELIVHAISEIIMQNCGRYHQVEVTPADLKENAFGAYESPTMKKLHMILENMRKLNCCKKKIGTIEVEEFAPIRVWAPWPQTVYIFDDPSKIKRELLDRLFQGKTLEELVREKKRRKIS